MPTLVSRDT